MSLLSVIPTQTNSVTVMEKHSLLEETHCPIGGCLAAPSVVAVEKPDAMPVSTKLPFQRRQKTPQQSCTRSFFLKFIFYFFYQIIPIEIKDLFSKGDLAKRAAA